MSTDEAFFRVLRYSTDHQVMSLAGTLATPNQAGTGEAVTFTDTAPSQSAPCYQVDATDSLTDAAATFAAVSPIVCPVAPAVTNPSLQGVTVGTPASLKAY